MPNPPKPTRLKILQGNPGKRPLNRREPQPTQKLPKCPVWLAPAAKKKWKSLVPELGRIGLLTVVDGDALAAYCQAWAEFEWATRTLAREGRTVTIPKTGYVMPHPAVAQQRSAWKAVREFSALFGLDPSSRSRLEVPGENLERDELEEFLRHG